MKRVLFLCTGNTCRSQMAEGIVNQLCSNQWQAFSAGTHPGERVNPFAVRAMSESGIDIARAQPKALDAFHTEPFDLVVTLCDSAAAECPYWPAAGRQLHIGFPDPADATGSADERLAVYRAVRDAIRAQVIPVLDQETS